ncbi:hypothetical protein [Tsuneonella sp. HG222]
MIILPWPDKRVTPNAKRRTHWRTYQPAIKSDRETGAVLAWAALPPLAREVIAAGEGKIPLKVSFFPPDRRHRDDDGMIGAFKHLRDGIADALKVDDRRFAPHYFFEEPVKGGRIVVQFFPEFSTAPGPALGASHAVDGKPPEIGEAA